MLGSTTRPGQVVGHDRWPAAPVAALEPVTTSVPKLLEKFLAARVAELVRIDPALAQVGEEVGGIALSGGKRLRPAFVYWGHRATGADHDDAVLVPAAAVELLHTFALIHDDVMDRSPERHGRPAVHTALAHVHTAESLVGDPDWFGVGGAILAGDLAFVWADELFDSAVMPSSVTDRARRVFTDLRIEVMAGQYLDLRLAGLPKAQDTDALRVALLKSGRYTVTRPLQLGAAVGGGDEALDAALCAFGDAIGVAFQLRDDILGLFGDPDRTGKGVLEDLREGKQTLLIVRAKALTDAAGRALLDRVIGDPQLDEADADRARQIIVDSGALDAVEQILARRLDSARRALAPVPAPAGDALSELADYALYRTV